MKKIAKFLALLLIVASCSSDDSSGGSNTVQPIADFSVTDRNVETGGSLTFTSVSLNAASFSWQFDGGTPSTSTEANPTITYNTPGVYDVSLTVSNSAGDDTATAANFITVSDPPAFIEATYTVTFTGNWSADTHPTDFPSNDHFSPAVGMVHNDQAVIFEAGELATEGIENMAETGSNDALRDEIGDIITNGMALAYINGGGLSDGLAQVSFEITISTDFPLVTLVSMIAPSPDWFVAVENVALFENGAFVDDLTVNALSYDAGTDSGSTFTSANDDTDPADPISLITEMPLGDGSGVDPPVALFTFSKIDQ